MSRRQPERKPRALKKIFLISQIRSPPVFRSSF
jgi:hypothetical protein